MSAVTQSWLGGLTMMQQSVLLSAIRGCDGIPKLHKAKALVKWYRRCILISAFDGKVLTDPGAAGGGSFTGPCVEYLPDLTWRQQMIPVVNDFLDSRDELPFHYQVHMMHAFEIAGYKHPAPETREFWLGVYARMVAALHLFPESEFEMDARLGDTKAGWEARNDPSTTCSN
jgi:hypothetical protein